MHQGGIHMIGTGIKKLAKENNLKISSGVAYGNLHGYASTFSEGNGYKRLVIATSFPDPEAERSLKAELDAINIEREFRVRSISFNIKCIDIMFRDAAGTMKKIRAFIDWFYPLLKEAGAAKFKICAECGQVIEKGTWKLINDVAYPLHKDCAVQVRNAFIEEHEAELAEEKGSFLTGLIGALLGAAIGSILWAVLYYFGYIASLAGLVIGLLAEKGYRLFKGRSGGMKVFILILSIIAGVLIGTFAADWYILYEMLQNGELPGFAVGDLIPFLIEMFKTDEALCISTAKDIGLGLVFAAIGVFALLRKTAKDTSPTKVKDLKD